MSSPINLYLASQSPRRSELLQQIGVGFERVRVDVPEQQQVGESPLDYVQRLAMAKAQAGAEVATGHPVLGADTIVVLGGEVLGGEVFGNGALGDKVPGERVLEKPTSEADAINILLSLSGQTHEVITAVAICYEGKIRSRVNTTRVSFRDISLKEAQNYWHTGEPADKAGAYGIQGLGAVFVERIEGSYSSVVGLPLLETAELLQLFEVPLWQG